MKLIEKLQFVKRNFAQCMKKLKAKVNDLEISVTEDFNTKNLMIHLTKNENYYEHITFPIKDWSLIKEKIDEIINKEE